MIVGVQLSHYQHLLSVYDECVQLFLCPLNSAVLVWEWSQTKCKQRAHQCSETHRCVWGVHLHSVECGPGELHSVAIGVDLYLSSIQEWLQAFLWKTEFFPMPGSIYLLGATWVWLNKTNPARCWIVDWYLVPSQAGQSSKYSQTK